MEWMNLHESTCVLFKIDDIKSIEENQINIVQEDGLFNIKINKVKVIKVI